MTVGERIKFLRLSLDITGAELASKSNINHSLIRKYETNRNIPKSSHIQKLADALDVSPFALTGEEGSIRIKTIGDIIGLLIIMIKNGIVTVEGERIDDFLIPDTIRFRFNNSIIKIIELGSDDNSFKFNTVFKDCDILNDFLKWEKEYRNYCYFKNKYKETFTKDMDNMTQNELEILEKMEQYSMIMEQTELLLQQGQI